MIKANRITDIQFKKNSRKITIFVDHQPFIEINQDLLLEFSFYIGQVLTQKKMDDILKKASLKKAQNYAIKLLSYRARSEFELSYRLKTKKFHSNIINQVIDWLKAKNLINDHEFASLWIKDRLHNKPIGKLKIKKELFQKGIDRDIVEKVISSYFSEEQDELNLAHQLISDKMKSFQSKKVNYDSKKIINLLKSRGFSYPIIKEIYNELTNNP